MTVKMVFIEIFFEDLSSEQIEKVSGRNKGTKIFLFKYYGRTKAPSPNARLSGPKAVCLRAG